MMTKGQWEEDDDLYGEGSDLGDDDDMGGDELEDEADDSVSPPPPAPVVVPPASRPSPMSARTQGAPVLTRHPVPLSKSPRRLKVKPMSANMRSKWPDVTSCLLTLASGQQVMFVRG